VGDLRSITRRLEHVRDLGADAIWLSPIYRSPMADARYDIADHTDADPIFGRLADADALIERAHQLGPRLLTLACSCWHWTAGAANRVR
jgi:alpha-glucosidase